MMCTFVQLQTAAEKKRCVAGFCYCESQRLIIFNRRILHIKMRKLVSVSEQLVDSAQLRKVADPKVFRGRCERCACVAQSASIMSLC
ncbi:hypothetical protein Y032_0083g1675 [Ancylostoma ceylanicum]|uniref:Uncharacterized protein n=1 Tax=Ancylostoma ceylanicum TaxID=53326 RepID=A0A016TR80_9BILA|nr:hypothetical protein Y032_0083g1675 [Ancylostoma ceylanicum]